MPTILSTEKVQLSEELPELHLRRGQIGVVCESWHYPTEAYEVEFRPDGKPVRVLLLHHQLSVAPENPN